MKYAIRATRGPGSIFGASSALVRRDGVLLVFENKEDAERLAAHYLQSTSSTNVHYAAEPYQEGA